MSAKINLTFDSYDRLDKIIAENKFSIQHTYNEQTGFCNSFIFQGSKKALAENQFLIDLIERKYQEQINVIQYIDRIDTISTISDIYYLWYIGQVGEITKINQIRSMPSVAASTQLIRNPSFINQDLSGWDDVSGAGVTVTGTVTTFTEQRFVELAANGDFIGQNVPAHNALNVVVAFTYFGLAEANSLQLAFVFTDGSNEVVNLSANGALQRYYGSPTTKKPLSSIRWYNQSALGNPQYVAEIIALPLYEDLDANNCILPKARNKTTLVLSGLANNSNGAIHTVTAAKTFYLSAAHLTGIAISAGLQQTITIQCDTAGDSVFRNLLTLLITTSALLDRESVSGNLSFPAGLPFPAGTVFRVTSANVDVFSQANIVGWEE